MYRTGRSTLDFRRYASFGGFTLHLLAVTGACAAECGDDTPDYTAQRTLLVNGATDVSKVYVSGPKIREERLDGKHPIVVLHAPEQQSNVLYDTERREGWQLPVPPRSQPTKKTRTVVDPGPNGTTIRHYQFENNGKWVELSTTTCTTAHVMLDQNFTIVDPQGHLMVGKLLQSKITVAPLGRELFEIPADVRINRLPISRSPP